MDPGEFQRHKALRRILWNALSEDDPRALAEGILNGANGEMMCIDEFAVALEMWLWRDDGRGRNKRKGLIAVAASNVTGVPPQGSLRCLRDLLLIFPPCSPACSKFQIKQSYYLAMQMGRLEAAEMLQGHAAYHDPGVVAWGIPLPRVPLLQPVLFTTDSFPATHRQGTPADEDNGEEKPVRMVVVVEEKEAVW